jgi:hypothetical protein
VTHPHNLAAVAALWSLRAASRYLDAHREAAAYTAATPAPAPVRQRSLGALGAWDTLLRQERAERAAAAAAGLKPSAGLRAPVSPALLDLHQEIASALTDATILIAHVHRRHPLLAWSVEWHTVIRAVFHIRRDPRWTYLSVALPATPAAIAAVVARQLSRVDTRIRTLCQVGPDQVPIAAAPRCPACGERRLRLQVSSPDPARWTVVCTHPDCLCRGPGQPGAGDACPCTMPERATGVRHIWWETDAPQAAGPVRAAA